MQLKRVAEPILAAAGVELVELSLRRGAGRCLVRIDIDRAGVRGVGLDDCQRVSRELGIALDKDEVLTTPYVLEVSSPGIDRPLRSPDDFRRNTGRTIVVAARDEDGVEREHRGRLVGFDGDELQLAAEGDTALRIPASRILRARQETTM